MDVGVHEPGDDAAPAGVEHPRSLREPHPAQPASGGADPDDLAVAGGDGGLLQHSQRAFPLARLAGDQLADAVDDQVGLDHGA